MRRPTISLSMCALLSAAAWGCGGAGGDPQVLTAPGRSTAPAANASPAGPPIDRARISVRPMSVPAALAIDGDVGEWGDLRPLARTPDEIEQRSQRPVRNGVGVEPSPEARDELGPHRENPVDAPSRLTLAIGGDAVVVAGALADAARSGVFVGVGSEPPLVPPIGEYTRVGGFDAMICPDTRHDYMEGARYDTGEPNTPEVIAACKEVLARYAALEASHEARFTRIYRIDASGVRVLDEGGKLAAVGGAKVIWKATPKGATFEATFPIAALPRFAQAPVSMIELVARPAPADPAALPPPLPRAVWFRDWFDAPVAFGPLADLRALVIERGEEPTQGGSYTPPLGLSYHPADPTHIESLAWAGGPTAVKPYVETLYTKKTTVGAYELGDVQAGRRYVAIFEDGKLVGAVARDGASRGMIARDGEVHFLDYTPETYVVHAGTHVPPSFRVIAVGPEGKARDALRPIDGDQLSCTHYRDVTEVLPEELDRFGFRSVCVEYMQERRFDVTWTWSPKEKLYLPKETTAPVKKTAPKR